MKKSFIPLLAFMTSLCCVSPYACAGDDPADQEEEAAPSAWTQAPLSFQDVLAHVYDDNPQLKSERDSLRILDERLSAAAGGYRPQLAVDGGIGESRVSENSAPWTYGVDRNAELVLTQPLYSGVTDGQWHAAKQRVLEGRTHLLAAEQKILLAAAAAWLDLYEKESLVDLNGDNERVAEDADMGCAARILYQAKEEMVHWAVTMKFHESSEDRFVNRCLYGGHRPAIEALLLRTLKDAGARGDMLGLLGLPARK